MKYLIKLQARLVSFKTWWKSYSIHSGKFLINIFTVAWCVFYVCLAVVHFISTLAFSSAMLAVIMVAFCVNYAEQIADVITKKRAVEVLGFELCIDEVEEAYLDPCDTCKAVGRVWYRRTDYFCDEGEYLCAGCIAAAYRSNKAEDARLERLEIEIRNEINVLVAHGHSLACAHDMAWVGADCECMPTLNSESATLLFAQVYNEMRSTGMGCAIVGADGVRLVDAILWRLCSKKLNEM